MTEETESPRPADEAPVKLWLTDAKGRCTFVNRAWWVYVGMPMKSQLGQGWLAAFHPNDLEPAQAAALEAAFAQGDAKSAARVAHTLKSNARLLGASALGACCEALEHAWRHGTLPPALPTDAAEMLARYRLLVERLCAELPR